MSAGGVYFSHVSTWRLVIPHAQPQAIRGGVEIGSQLHTYHVVLALPACALALQGRDDSQTIGLFLPRRRSIGACAYRTLHNPIKSTRGALQKNNKRGQPPGLERPHRCIGRHIGGLRRTMKDSHAHRPRGRGDKLEGHAVNVARFCPHHGKRRVFNVLCEPREDVREILRRRSETTGHMPY